MSAATSDKRHCKATAKVTDQNNTATPETSAHREAREQLRTSQLPASSNPTPPSQVATITQPVGASSAKRKSPTIEEVFDEDDDLLGGPKAGPSDSKRSRVISSPTSSADDEGIEILESTTSKFVSKTADIDEFFHPAQRTADGKLKRQCKLCMKRGSTSAGLLVNEGTTLWRHIEASHLAKHDSWITKNDITSKLPKAVKRAKEQAAAADRSKQSSIEPHLQTGAPLKECVIQYSDTLFRDAAIEWLVATDQPIQALEHPTFIKMIDIASRATNGVRIPNRKATRKAIVELFKQNLTKLRNRVTSDKTGLVSLMCDAWQASNQDAYFAVTGHWNEEMAPGVWEAHSALFGFTQMNSAHDGVRLGQALFNIVRRLGIVHKVGWITCDNASNNITMLKAFQTRVNTSSLRKGKKNWNWEVFHIRCLAHVINLATQALISTYSKSNHFDAANPTVHEPDVDAWGDRDEVGLVRAITVKVRSSAKRKEKFKKLQVRAQHASPKTLLLDMKVRWSSTYEMLCRAHTLKTFTNKFVYEIGREELDLEKRRKIDALKLTVDEWTHIEKMITLLECADNAQQAFSYENTPTLHSGLPAMEGLYNAWTTRAKKQKYAPFVEALNAAAAKIDEYYQKTATSHAYTFAMLLDPESKLTYFKNNWGKELADDVRDAAEKIFKERYIEMYGEGTTSSRPTERKRGNQKLAKLFAAVSDDESDVPTTPAPSSTPISVGEDIEDTSKPWMREFKLYLDSVDELPEGMSKITWWGINSPRITVWASLARDYLAIMGSSVSSERAFSAAGITISKRRNRLKADIVEALQFLKALIRADLLYREPMPSSVLEEELEIHEDDADTDWIDEPDPPPWSDLIISIDTDSETEDN